MIDIRNYLAVWKGILVMAQFLPGCLLMLKYAAPHRRWPALALLSALTLILVSGSVGIAYIQRYTVPYIRDIIYNPFTVGGYMLLLVLLTGVYLSCTELPPARLLYVFFHIIAVTLSLTAVLRALTPLMPNRTLLISICYYLIIHTLCYNTLVFIAQRLVLRLPEIDISTLKKYCWAMPLSLCVMLVLILRLGVPHNAEDCYALLGVIAALLFLYLLIMWTILHIAAELTDSRQFMVRAKQMEDFYVNLTRSVQQSRTYRHDIRHHFTMIRQMNRDGLSDEIDVYLTNYLSSVPPEPANHYTGNYYIDALIYHFFRLAQNEGIHTYIQLNLPAVLRIAPYDLCTIFGNSLENAVDACRQQRDGHRFIRVQGEMINQKIILIFSNSFNGHILMSEHLLSTKPGSGHGYGVQSVEFSASRYDGQVKIDYAEHVFRISIVLNQPPVTEP